jgi:hypothetical protein
VIVVWDERKTKPFDRDTELRLTGDQLAQRGARDLAEALALLPEVNIRDIARGGSQIEIRGARKSSVKVFVDGIPLGDPYRGNFDVTSIPVTDIVEVRISASPASPIDGTGGPGGVVEVHTREAVGARMLIARADVNSLPQERFAASTRTMIGDFFAVRASATGDVGSRDLNAVVPDNQPVKIGEDRRSIAGALRLEYRRGTRRVAIDGSAQTGTYLVPPSETDTGQIIDIDKAVDARLGLVAEDEVGGWRLQGRSYIFTSRRKSLFYPDARLEGPPQVEDVHATSVGGRLLANRPIGEKLQLLGSVNVDSDYGTATTDMSTIGGRATMSEAATGFKWTPGMVRMDGAVGLAVPLDVGAKPFPEAKLSLKASPLTFLTTRVVGGYKGRLPTLRERFEIGDGNAALGPEKALYAEVGARLEKNDYVDFDVAGYVRHVNGFIRFNQQLGMLINIGELTMYGTDMRAIAFPFSPIRGGGSVELVKVKSAFGDDAIDRLPKVRGDLWVDGQWHGRFGGIARWRYVGEMQDQGNTLPDYYLFDLSAYVRIYRDIMANAGVDNMLDKRYLDRAAGIYGVGRVFRLGVQGTFE